jgi:ribosomal protein S18 acetylase RimI-like enzyme
MQIHNLQNTTIEEIAACFNKAFEHYFVPLKLDMQQLCDKIKSENILLEHSIGVTINNELAGFILIGIDVDSKVAYNSGTGIIPEYRGQRLTEKMYASLLPQLKKTGIQHHLLDVICENQKALKIYQNLGYSILRKVICYKGKVSEYNGYRYQIEAIGLPAENELKQFWNHKPTYQNSLFCIKNNPEKHVVFGAFNLENLIGYIIFDKNTLRIKQFGIDKAFRNKGLGHLLFYQVQMQQPETDIVLINIDENDLETNKFLRNIGFNKLIEQYEMMLGTNQKPLHSRHQNWQIPCSGANPDGK